MITELIFITLMVGCITGLIVHFALGRRGSLAANLFVGALGALIGGYVGLSFHVAGQNFIWYLLISIVGALIALAIIGVTLRRHV